MKLKSLYIIKVCLLALLVVSCDHKEFCYNHPHTTKVRVNVDWSEFEEENPTGMTVMVYPTDGRKPSTSLTHTLDHATFNLSEGVYHTLVYNQSMSEFGSVDFVNMNVYEKAEVVGATHDSRWYVGRADGGRVVAQPEWIAVDGEEGTMVTQEMVENQRVEGKYRTSDASEYVLSSLVPQNIIYTVHVRVHIKGIYNLRSARAALDGMAEGYRFKNACPSDVPATYLMEEWEMTVDKTDPTKGYIDTNLFCFGLPEGHQGIADENLFTLSVLLVDNETILNLPFMVGDLFTRGDDNIRLHLNLEIELPEPLPDVKPAGGGSSGFDATVDDWGDEIEQDIIM